MLNRVIAVNCDGVRVLSHRSTATLSLLLFSAGACELLEEEANLLIYCCVFKMGEIWWSLLGSAIPVVVAGQAFRLKKRRAEEQRLQSGRGRERNSDEIFVCERVCTSKRMLKKLGSFSKDPIPDTCVTVCGVSDVDACADACARTVCINQHQVPNWNDICLRRCQSECLKLSSQSRSS
ncbi:hypothetical protein JHK82_056945 [Glycine max]|nr:hypothetical protein JHK82_056945 [Glycine max]